MNLHLLENKWFRSAANERTSFQYMLQLVGSNHRIFSVLSRPSTRSRYIFRTRKINCSTYKIEIKINKTATRNMVCIRLNIQFYGDSLIRYGYIVDICSGKFQLNFHLRGRTKKPGLFWEKCLHEMVCDL